MEKFSYLNEIIFTYLKETTKAVLEKASRKEGREILGEVINRPEDIDIGIDRVGEEVLQDLIKRKNIKATIFSEPEGRDIKNGNPEIYGAIDPFDGSVLYLRGFEHNWYTALSFFDKKRNPLCTGIADILNQKFFISDTAEKNYLFDLKTGKKEKIFSSKRDDLNQPLVLASYIMSSQYSKKFLDFFGDLIKKLHPKAIFYPNGGSYIYGYLASGLIDAYIMFDEPRSEIDPGYPIAKRAGCEVLIVDSDGNWRDYEFLPGCQHDKVPLLLAVNGERLRNQIIAYYVKKYKEKYFFRF